MRRLIVACVVAGCAALAAAGPATAEPTWAPAASATVHPGVQTFTEGAQCTANFVFFDARDEHDHAQVCVIGQEIRRNLFGYGPVLGKQLKVNDVWLEVVGVLASDPGSAARAPR